MAGSYPMSTSKRSMPPRWRSVRKAADSCLNSSQSNPSCDKRSATREQRIESGMQHPMFNAGSCQMLANTAKTISGNHHPAHAGTGAFRLRTTGRRDRRGSAGTAARSIRRETRCIAVPATARCAEHRRATTAVDSAGWRRGAASKRSAPVPRACRQDDLGHSWLMTPSRK